MLYTKQLVSGKDINLKEHLLGVIKQPIIDDFMGDYDLEEFTKVFYIEQTWKVNGVFENDNIPKLWSYTKTYDKDGFEIHGNKNIKAGIIEYAVVNNDNFINYNIIRGTYYEYSPIFCLY